MSSHQNNYVDLRLKFLRPNVEGVATQIWVATHYLRTPALQDAEKNARNFEPQVKLGATETSECKPVSAAAQMQKLCQSCGRSECKPKWKCPARIIDLL